MLTSISPPCPRVPAAELDERPTEAMAGVEAATLKQLSCDSLLKQPLKRLPLRQPRSSLQSRQQPTADFATADWDAGSPAEEQLVDANAETWSVLEPVADPDPALQTDQDQPMAADSRFSRFTALLKDCLDDVGRVVDREDSTSSIPSAPASAPSAAPSPRPVPASGPRRLRRWLAPVDADDLPKAS